MSDTGRDVALQANQLAKTYALGFFRKKVRAITDVNLRVERGEIFGLLGPNGAGKTTTLKIVMGLVRPSRGSAQILGHRVGELASKRLIGYLPESPYFYDYLTGRELLVFVGQLFGLSRRESRRRAGELIERVDLKHAADRALRRYSKGMLQRIGLAQALINEPELVVLDEPLTGLDPLGRKHLRELIGELGRQGKTVILSSHILSDVELLANRVAILVRGRTVDSGPLSELVTARVLSYEVLVEQPTDALLTAIRTQGHRVQRVDQKALIELHEASAVDVLVDLVRQHQCSVVAINPRKETLEDVVVGKAASSPVDQAS
jgi:ABC-2 type transport system ATP-binding protein